MGERLKRLPPHCRFLGKMLLEWIAPKPGAASCGSPSLGSLRAFILSPGRSPGLYFSNPDIEYPALHAAACASLPGIYLNLNLLDRTTHRLRAELGFSHQDEPSQ